MFFVILVDDDYCVAIHDLSPVLTALFSIELGGFNSQHNGCCRQSTHSLLEVVTVSQLSWLKKSTCSLRSVTEEA